MKKKVFVALTLGLLSLGLFGATSFTADNAETSIVGRSNIWAG